MKILEENKEPFTIVALVITALFATGQALGLWYVDRAATSLDAINIRLLENERAQVEMLQTLKWMREEILENKSDIKELHKEHDMFIMPRDKK